MYICICKGITEEQLQFHVKEGLPTKEILKRLGVGQDCGTCLISSIESIKLNLNVNKNQDFSNRKK